ncbi:MAG: HEAT repeat domain-containing protein [Ignavibacteriae bacterium]|nr:HEAT repeat domain-containing protein [Ignavibacteriota bacterium]
MDMKINNSKDLEIKNLLENLVSENGVERKSARKNLVKKGPVVIDFLMEHIHHPKHLYRWEALKTMEEIADPVSVPLFIEALEDDESDIRWIAAEGLIKIGSESINPLLKTLTKKTDSIFILAGAHHVFHDLNKKNSLPKDFPIDNFLSNIKKSESDEAIKLLAFQILSNLEEENK